MALSGLVRIAVDPELLTGQGRLLTALSSTYPLEFAPFGDPADSSAPPAARICCARPGALATVVTSGLLSGVPGIVFVEPEDPKGSSEAEGSHRPGVRNTGGSSHPDARNTEGSHRPDGRNTEGSSRPDPRNILRDAAYPIRFTESGVIDSSLRGASLGSGIGGRPAMGMSSLIQNSAPAGLSDSPAEWISLAERGNVEIWSRATCGTADVDVVLGGLSELPVTTDLMRTLLGENPWPYLPLVHFLLRVLERSGWDLPPLRACFLFDDPNLHWGTYGWVDYAELAEFCQSHDVHVSFATIPIDSWWVSERAARWFRGSDRLSLIVHGNNHTSSELGGEGTREGTVRMLSQALRRIHRLERKGGVRVDRVMAPPHGACGQRACEVLSQLGYVGLTANRPRPWADDAEADWPGAGLGVVQVTPGLIPVLTRVPFDRPESELRIRALLRQPLILYGHHGDLKHGLSLLEERAALIHSLGAVEWSSLGEIAVRTTLIYRGDAVCRSESEPMFHHPPATHRPSIDPEEVPAPRWRAWPVLRRVLTEARDHMSPLAAGRRRRRGV